MTVGMAMGRYGSGFAPPRYDQTRLETRPKKTRYCPAPSALTSTRLTRPDQIFFFFFAVDTRPRDGPNDPLVAVQPEPTVTHHRSRA